MANDKPLYGGWIVFVCILLGLTFGCRTDPGMKVSLTIKDPGLFANAQRLYEKKNYGQAKSLFEEYIRFRMKMNGNYKNIIIIIRAKGIILLLLKRIVIIRSRFPGMIM